MTRLAFVAAIGGAGLGLWTFTHDVSLRFWLGDLPRATLSVLLASLSLLFAILLFRLWTLVMRKYHSDHVGLHRRVSTNLDLPQPFQLSARFLRHSFALIAASGAAAAALGGLTLNLGTGMVDSLTAFCGAGGASAEIEQVYQDLWAFQSRCHEDPADSGAPVQSCPGFLDAFPLPAPYARYLKVLEDQEGCAGFCRAADAPLFVRPEGFQRREACAAAVGAKIWTATHAVGVGSIVVGALLAVIGTAFCVYDEL